MIVYPNLTKKIHSLRVAIIVLEGCSFLEDNIGCLYVKNIVSLKLQLTQSGEVILDVTVEQGREEEDNSSSSCILGLKG
jgi:hypothetical protein